MMRAPRMPRNAARKRIWLGGVNLLPYRARDRRRRRARCWLLGAGAPVCGCAFAMLACVQDVREARHTDARRVEIERSLGQAGIGGLPRPMVAGATQMPGLIASRATVIEGFDTVSQLFRDSVRLQTLRGDERGFSMRVEARDPTAAQHWLEHMRDHWHRHVFEIEDVRALAANAQAVILTVRMNRGGA